MLKLIDAFLQPLCGIAIALTKQIIFDLAVLINKLIDIFFLHFKRNDMTNLNKSFTFQ
jgi:hypothetical protein